MLFSMFWLNFLALEKSNANTIEKFNNIHSHKKRKDSLQGNLDRVLFAAEPKFPKILVPRLPQNTSNVNIECAGKSKQLYSFL